MSQRIYVMQFRRLVFGRFVSIALMWMGMCSTLGCGSQPAPKSPDPYVAPEPEPQPIPLPVIEPEAGVAMLSTAFLVGGDMAETERNAITDQVTHAITQAMGKFRQCYAKHMERGNQESGEIDIELVLQPGPSIGVLRSGKGTLRDPMLIDCTVQVFSQLQMPSPPSDYTIIAPIQYRPQ